MKFKTQKFNVSAARMQSTMLSLAAIALIVPAAFHYLSGPAGVIRERRAQLRHLDRAADDLCVEPGLFAAHPQAAVLRAYAPQRRELQEDRHERGRMRKSVARPGWLPPR